MIRNVVDNLYEDPGDGQSDPGGLNVGTIDIAVLCAADAPDRRVITYIECPEPQTGGEELP